MSSILKALKKLESEKSQRDELSTAVASDILRTSRNKQGRAFLKVFTGFIVVFLIAAAGYFLAVKTADIQSVDTLTSPVAGQQPAVRTDSAKTESMPADTVDLDLPNLSGIVYQQDPQSRLAIINDLPVMEGTLVADFEVKEIRPDQVVLLRDNVEFVLLLDQQ